MQINFHPATGTPYPVPAPMRFRNGLGNLGQSSCQPTAPNQSGSPASIAAIAAQGAATTASILGGVSAMTTAAGAGFLSGATIAGMAASAAIPLIGAAIVGLTALGIAIAKEFQGCGQTCIEASCIANNVGAYLAQNCNTYLASPVRYASMQTAALNNFDTGWNALVTACGAAALQQAGQNCISDRKRGSCAYHTSPGGWAKTNGVWTFTPNGPNGSGTACWDWFIGYRDPIANDPAVVPDPTSTSDLFDAPGQLTTGASTTGTSSLPIPLILGGLLLGFMAMEN